MFRIKQGFSILEALKDNGYTTYRIAREGIFGSATMQKFRKHGLPSWNELDKLCIMLHCKPWDIIEYIPGSCQDQSQEHD